ncbi:MAG: amidohydrolase [Gammaproteobacteria bacterium]|nr:amidohydrolase [Gammaproteobacteria bacterium]
MKFFILVTLLFSISACASLSGKPPPFADVHLHFNWDQEELVSAEQAIEILKRHNVELAVVTATPSSNAVKLRKAGGDWVLPIYSPYIDVRARYGWFNRPDVLVRARKALQSGEYFGIGEVHLVIGLGPRRDNRVFTGLLALAEEFNLPFLLHTEAGSYKYMESVCRKYPKIRFLWAHAGGLLGADHSDKLLASCKNVWIELSARDPHHYGTFLIGDNRVSKPWLNVFKKYPDRFMTGTDPVWKASEIHRWDRADEGWLHFDEFIQFHRHWMSQLPPDIERKIRLENGKRFWLGK